MSTGLLIIRLLVGLLMAGHGAQKMFGWFGGPGFKGTTGWMQSMNMKPAALMAFLAGAGELVGGLMIAIGVGFPVGAALIVITMLVAIIKVHVKNGLWATKGGIEYNLVLLGVAVALALIGPGRFVA